MSLTSLGKFYQHLPRVATIVTAHAGNKDNAMTVVWHSPLSLRPPLYGIAITSGRFTYELISKSGEFGVNFLPLEAAELAASVGGSTGRRVDKFEKFHILREKPVKTSVPLLKDAYACYECKLVDDTIHGDHHWLVGEIVVVHSLDEAFVKEGMLNTDRVNPAMYLGSDFYITTDKGSKRHLSREICGESAHSD
jgi:flavin reductase (DIM6/NTAB) family NADH-FMN oxidoreductase RutF